jgi:hypothetical protein
MMNPELKAKWVAALRSGEYQQCSDAMHVSDEHDDDAKGYHCCLGVLRHLTTGTNDIGEVTIADDDPYTMPTIAERKAWGLTYRDVSVLAAKNDGGRDVVGVVHKRKTFAGIATYIEGRKTL